MCQELNKCECTSSKQCSPAIPLRCEMPKKDRLFRYLMRCKKEPISGENRDLRVTCKYAPLVKLLLFSGNFTFLFLIFFPNSF